MASVYYDLAAANAALKELYEDQAVHNLVYKHNPWLAMITKRTDFGGKYKPIPIITGVSQGRSSVFANAQGNQSPVQIESFLLTRKSDYSIATIDQQTLLAAKTNKMAFLESAKVVVDGAIRAATLSAASAMYRAGTGSIGQISSVTAGVITLVNIIDVVQFEVNQVLQSNATDGGATPRTALGYVTAIDRTAGTVTVSATALGGTPGTPSGWVANDFVLVQGDNNAKCSGFAAWLPGTAPTSIDNYYGVARGVDPVRLAGVRYNGSSQTLEEALIDAAMITAREGGMPEHCLTNYTSFAGLEKSLGAKIQYINAKGDADIGFKGIAINGGNSTINVFPDRNCQALQAWLIQADTWSLESLNDVPHISRYGDGLEMLRVSNADASELRVASYFNAACQAPGWNANVTLGS